MVRRYVLNGEGDGSHSISGIDYASELNEQQLAAVMERHGIEWERKGTHEDLLDQKL